tara:strand:+ start:237 stop:563 length:327 start_codon:yes stop_codon:yes gene_type:complete
MKVGRIKVGEWGKLRAFFDLEVGGFTIKGFKIVEGSNGLFVSMPSQKNEEGEYNDTVWVDKDTRSKLNEVALEAYSKGDTPRRMSGGSSEIDRIHTSNSYADKDEIPF